MFASLCAHPQSNRHRSAGTGLNLSSLHRNPTRPERLENGCSSTAYVPSDSRFRRGPRVPSWTGREGRGPLPPASAHRHLLDSGESSWRVAHHRGSDFLSLLPSRQRIPQPRRREDGFPADELIELPRLPMSWRFARRASISSTMHGSSEAQERGSSCTSQRRVRTASSASIPSTPTKMRPDSRKENDKRIVRACACYPWRETGDEGDLLGSFPFFTGILPFKKSQALRDLGS